MSKTEKTRVVNNKTFVQCDDGYTYVYDFADRAVDAYVDTPIAAFLTDPMQYAQENLE